MAGILSLKLYIEMLIGESLLRLATSTRYPQFIQMRSKRKLTPLEALTTKFEPPWKTTLESMENIVFFIIPPWMKPPKVHIEQDKVQAKTLHERLLQTLSKEITTYYININVG